MQPLGKALPNQAIPQLSDGCAQPSLEQFRGNPVKKGGPELGIVEPSEPSGGPRRDSSKKGGPELGILEPSDGDPSPARRTPLNRAAIR